MTTAGRPTWCGRLAMARGPTGRSMPPGIRRGWGQRVEPLRGVGSGPQRAHHGGAGGCGVPAAGGGPADHPFQGKIRETPGCLYGRDWAFGDKVTATYMGLNFDCIILAVQVTVDGSGKETLDARLEALL